jgi:hypothetical protein
MCKLIVHTDCLKGMALTKYFGHAPQQGFKGEIYGQYDSSFFKPTIPLCCIDIRVRDIEGV